jgi:hypothetical protein
MTRIFMEIGGNYLPDKRLAARAVGRPVEQAGRCAYSVQLAATISLT